ncbi:30S ribosomal protein S6 [Mycoplasma sp. 4079]|uniref:30S ribosomal protein S6 n=1 Tax=Mycoplasma sp. 4079 TaxID=3398615 RepID=UPI0039FBE935
MQKYEIMSIVSPKADVQVLIDLLNEVFGKENISKVEKLERNELAYEINKSKHGQYVLAFVNAKGSDIAEFTRRSNIIKDIWRALVINLDTEKGLNGKESVKETKKPVRRTRKSAASAEEKVSKPRTRTVKAKASE